LDGLAGLPLALLGSSAGGAVATEAVRRGAPVDALVLLAAPAAWLSFAADPSAGMRRIVQEAGMPLDADALADPSAWASEFDAVTTENSIPDVRVPTLIVHGTGDEVVPVDHATRIAERARNAEIRIVEGAAHQLRREGAVVELVVDWLHRRL
ncbi:MAG: alpha/beta hydrolase family protein, partial [Actinomycetota bacterium]